MTKRKADEKIMGRIQALLNLANEAKRKGRSEEQLNEAKAAMCQAAALMAKHGLSQTEVELTGAETKEPGIKVSVDAMATGQVHQQKTSIDRWDKGCAVIATRVAGCRWYYREPYKFKGQTIEMAAIVFYGLPEDVAVARVLWPWLRKSMNDACAAYLKEYFNVSGINPKLRSTVEARSYKDGWIGGVSTAVYKQQEKLEKENVSVKDTTGTALVVRTGDLVAARNEALDAYSAKLGLGKGKATGARQRDWSSYDRGHKDGSTVRVSKDQIG